MSETNAHVDPEVRVEQLARETDFGWVAEALSAHREVLLSRWLEAATAQPFHRGVRASAVADDIPLLVDALIGLLRRETPRWVDPTAPLDDPAIRAAAESHAAKRSEQGLQPADVVVEFRLLRQEIWNALRRQLPDHVPTGDVVGAEIMLNDALDAAITVGLVALTNRLETVREDFLATTVHEVRQPVTVIRGAAQLMRRTLNRGVVDPRQLGEQLRRVEQAADRMASLLAALADSSRVALGRLDLRPVSCNLAALASGVVDQLDLEQGRRVQLDLPPESEVTGTWDPERLEQVILNLLSNALKYSPAEAPVDLVVRGDEHTVALSVRDRGIGLAPDELPQLFRRYGRARGAFEHGIGGLGLGLFLCRAIVSAHAGRIWAESAGTGQGTTMQVVLPRTTPLA